MISDDFSVTVRADITEQTIIMKKILVSIIILFTPFNLNAEQPFFTYTGLTFGGGIDSITYSDWSPETNRRETNDLSGTYYCSGILLNIFVRDLIGEFSIQYINNSNDEIPVSHVIYDVLGKYSYPLTESISVAGGAGLYLETPPASRGYNSGGGLSAAFGPIYSIGKDWKIMLDIAGRHGHFGIGEDSTRISYGARLSVVYKTGRI